MQPNNKANFKNTVVTVYKNKYATDKQKNNNTFVTEELKYRCDGITIMERIQSGRLILPSVNTCNCVLQSPSLPSALSTVEQWF